MSKDGKLCSMDAICSQVKLQFVAKPQLGRKNAGPMRPLTAKTGVRVP